MQAHFFTVPTDFIDDFKEAIVFISQPTSQVEAFRSLCLQEFEVAAERLFPDKVSEGSVMKPSGTSCSEAFNLTKGQR